VNQKPRDLANVGEVVATSKVARGPIHRLAQLEFKEAVAEWNAAPLKEFVCPTPAQRVVVGHTGRAREAINAAAACERSVHAKAN